MNQSSTEQAIFAEALSIATPESRAVYLNAMCGADAALRQRVEALLRAAEQAGDFLERPPTQLLANNAGGTVRIDFPTEQPGDRIGRYKLLQQIGEGGCGVVYMAEQEEPVRRRVALKVIKLGMDTKAVIARFEAERQALAMMDHPNIAKVFDAGTTEKGRPYFVMELVRGVRITDFCDENKLPTEERLKLFTQVCQAVQHAHQKGIIHRDIKPSNILVSVSEPGSPGCPKVIDFGIAKATTGQQLTDKTLFTAFEQFIGTPAYMSPEQAMLTSLDIDTRTDIYALGVLLYELLTGQTPFDGNDLMAAGLDAMRRIIREQEPARPSTRLSTMMAEQLTDLARHRQAEPAKLSSQLRGDLDWIVMKCLEKDRARRYETANGLALDIQRHLANEAVTARPPSQWYRIQKSIQRNRLAWAAGAAVMLVLIAGLVVSTTLYFQARRQADKSQRLAQVLKDTLNGLAPGVAPGRDSVLLRELASEIAKNVDAKLKSEPETAMELELLLARVYWQLRAWDKMADAARQVRRLAVENAGKETLPYADATGYLGRALVGLFKPQEAEAAAREAIALQCQLRGPGSANEADALACLGDTLRMTHRLAEAESVVKQAVSLRRQRAAEDGNALAWTLHTLNIILENEGKFAEADAGIREAITIWKKISPGKDTWPLAAGYERLGRNLLAYGDTNRLPEAEEVSRKSLLIEYEILGPAHPALVYPHSTLAQALERQEKFAEAEINYRRAAEVARSAAAMSSEEKAFFVRQYGEYFGRHGDQQAALKLQQEAEALSASPRQ